MPPFHPSLFGIELLFTGILLVLCLVIYFKTRESYKLTKHQGINLFRKAFLFFGLSYLIRLFFMFSKFTLDFHFFRSGLKILFILPLGYLSTMAILYLIYSIIWKKFNIKYLLIFSHILAIILSIAAFLTRTHILLLYLQSIFLIATIIILFLKRKKSLVKTLYLLIFFFWLINLWAIAPGRVLFVEFKIIFHLISVGLFVGIYYKVSRWLK